MCVQGFSEETSLFANRLRAICYKVNRDMTPVELGERFFHGLRVDLRRFLKRPKGRTLEMLLEVVRVEEKLLVEEKQLKEAADSTRGTHTRSDSGRKIVAPQPVGLVENKTITTGTSDKKMDGGQPSRGALVGKLGEN